MAEPQRTSEETRAAAGRRRPWALFALCVRLSALVGCGGAHPPALDTTRPADDPAEASRPKAAPAAPRSPAPSSAVAAPPVVVPRTPISIADCPIRWVPEKLQASVSILPKAYVGRFMLPLFDAVCACTRPGDHLVITARVLTGSGDLSAVTGPGTEPPITADLSVDACLAGVLSGRRFEPFDVPSDVACEESTPPAADAGGPPSPESEHLDGPVSFFSPPRRVGCDEHAGATIVYPIVVDRRGELPRAP